MNSTLNDFFFFYQKSREIFLMSSNGNEMCKCM